MSDSPALDFPAKEYTRRLRARESRAAHLEKHHARIGTARLALAALTIAAAGCAWMLQAFSPGWLLLPAVAFLGLVIWHHTVRRGRARALRAAAVYEKGLARIEDRWAGKGHKGTRFEDAHHVFSSDLDLFGGGGLFELLCAARTRMGEDTLAGWLLAPADVDEIRLRHAAIDELKDRLDLREDLAVLGEESAAGVHPDALLQWAQAPNRLQQHWIRWLAPVLAIAAVALAVVWNVTGLASPFFLLLGLEATIAYRLRGQLHETVYATEKAFEDLGLLSGWLERMEREGLRAEFEAPRLRELLHALTSHHLSAAQAISRLRTRVQLMESRRNPILAVLDIPLMYSVQVAVAAEAWRRAHGAAVGTWLRATGEIEALVSLATYRYEHPADALPEFVPGPASFRAESLGHPLIRASDCVRNNVDIGGDTQVLLVSGSNMSGKSTLLRGVGINVVLAMAGAPVRAARLRLTTLQVGASIRVNDSLQEGNSRFYAEIKRLRQIYDLANRRPPLLFLLDELLQGTNSADRRVGAQGIVRALLERGAIGLVSTHDLALTDINGGDGVALRNVHFEDSFEQGRMTFDFKLRDGVVTKSNALELMRSIGLQV